MRAAVLFLALGLAGCNCQPLVVVPADGGSAGGGGGGSGGAGGGTTGSVDAGCASAAQCTAAAPAQSLCTFGGADAGFSCLDHRCVFECFQGRTCDFDAGTACLSCAPGAVTSCVQTGCGAMTRQAQVEAMTAGCSVGFTNVMWVPLGNCQWRVTDATGDKGVVTQLGSGQYVGVFDAFGTCVGTSTFGQVERVVFSCPGCQFQIAL